MSLYSLWLDHGFFKNDISTRLQLGTGAGWFTEDAMPDLPMGGSISRHMIDSFLNEVQF